MKTVSKLFSTLSAVLLTISPALVDAEEKLGLDISDVTVEVTANDFNSIEEDLIVHLKTVMKEFHVVTKDVWTHQYTHIALADASGTLKWTEDDSKIWKWMVRPGGLATVTDENGITTYLAKEVK